MNRVDVGRAPPRQEAIFTTGSTMRHVLVMASTGAVGLMAVFAVDLLTLLYVSWLGDTSLTAAVGFAGILMFVTVSTSIGLLIAVSALVSRTLGRRDVAAARRIAGSTVTIAAAISGTIGLAMLIAAHPLLVQLGATGRVLETAHRFLLIALPGTVFMGLGMALSAVLRAVGDARRSMYVTLAGAITTAVCDPLLIFVLGLGVDGAAIVTLISRVVVALVGFHGAVVVHRMVARPSRGSIRLDGRPMLAIALPAMAANVATPIAAGFMTSILARYGEEAVAANAIISRLVPVAFGLLFAMSGAIGPILGQNFGAGLLVRVRRTFSDALICGTLYILAAWLVLALAQNLVVAAFAAQGETADLLRLFCAVLAGSWIFHGALFLANSAFNNLGFPLLTTVLNWGKATLGTIPFGLAGAHMGGAAGALIGQGIGAIAFGIASVVLAYRAIDRLGEQARPAH
ncbi:MATE family efflux transporter [Chelatococcus reniformis]|uniref:MATE family efflux transporter n=1 Tax=Chelatococcus reniformis TaxID=1494448 RepID=A0A916UX39_9HYPH|nr:MATE family efflux transporter [Chelatococcus reniformis]GGC91044.1 MATE family efflux transporter [Chelatococcus reniformis]